MARKLAIVISGAVSLGSYEAGVMYELLEAIALYNENLEADHPERVVIDVITGASAGAMTAAILSQQLYFGGVRMRAPYGNPLFDAWVDKVNIDKLLEVEPRNHQYSLLSSAVVDEIGKTHIPNEPGDQLDRHPASANALQIGIAMSNLNGFSQEISGDSESFAYSRYKDQFVCRVRCVASKDGKQASVGQATDTTLDLSEMEPRRKGRKVIWRPMQNSCDWGILREMALSSGAFPFAFRARRIVRSGGSASSLMVTRDSSRKSSSGDKLYGGNYLYTDGGVFENEPVGMAASLTEEIDEKHGNSDRSYLFVAPGKRSIDADPFFNREDDLLAMAAGLAGAVFGQSRYQQWITEGLEGKLLTVTATDASLIGDVFSAFAGFLEYDFRAHDYNIGRRNARQKLRKGNFSHLIGDFRQLDKKMPMIDWPENSESIWSSSPSSQVIGKNAYSDEQTPDDYGEYETDLWKQVRDDLLTLANPGIIVDKSGQQKRDQLRELRNLMVRVRIQRRNLIAQQLYARVGSLVDFFNERYLDKLDSRRRTGALRWLLRQTIGKPLTKVILKRLIAPILTTNILEP